MLLAVWTVPHVVLIQLFRLLKLSHATVQVNLFVLCVSSFAIWELLDICKEQEVLLFPGDVLMPSHVKDYFLLASESLFIFKETVIALLVDSGQQLRHCHFFSEGQSAVTLLLIIAKGIGLSVASNVPDSQLVR